jgi:hypothetical protein
MAWAFAGPINASRAAHASLPSQVFLMPPEYGMQT